MGGGLVVISTGWAMLKQRADDEHKATCCDVQQDDPLRHAFYPFTLPLTVGPGSISVAITLGANAVHHHGLNLTACSWRRFCWCASASRSCGTARAPCLPRSTQTQPPATEPVSRLGTRAPPRGMRPLSFS